MLLVYPPVNSYGSEKTHPMMVPAYYKKVVEGRSHHVGRMEEDALGPSPLRHLVKVAAESNDRQVARGPSREGVEAVLEGPGTADAQEDSHPVVGLAPFCRLLEPFW